MSNTWYGRRPPENVETTAEWGARAILATFDIPFDRQQMNWDKGTRPDWVELSDWLSNTGLPAIRRLITQQHLHSTEDRTITYTDGLFVVEANPQRSAGHLYIGAWKLSATPSTPTQITITAEPTTFDVTLQPDEDEPTLINIVGTRYGQILGSILQTNADPQTYTAQVDQYTNTFQDPVQAGRWIITTFALIRLAAELHDS